MNIKVSVSFYLCVNVVKLTLKMTTAQSLSTTVLVRTTYEMTLGFKLSQLQRECYSPAMVGRQRPTHLLSKISETEELRIRDPG